MVQAVSDMKGSAWLSRLLGLGAALETLAGLALLAIPSAAVLLLLGEPLSSSGVVIARIAGGGLLGLGIACWFAREVPTSRVGIGVAVGFLAYNVVASVTLALAQSANGSRLLLIGAAALHAVLALALVAALTAGSSGRPRDPGAQRE